MPPRILSFALQVPDTLHRLWIHKGDKKVAEDEPIEWAIAMHGGAGEIKNVNSIDTRLEEFEKILQVRSLCTLRIYHHMMYTRNTFGACTFFAP